MQTFETRFEQMESRMARAECRARVMGALALVVVVGAIALSVMPSAKAQGGGQQSLAARVAALETKVAALRATVNNQTTQIAAMQTQVDSQADQIAALENLLIHFSRIGNEVFITGANLHIRNGMGSTETINSVGNLIVGYNEIRFPLDQNDRNGSHNIVVGRQNNFSRFGGLVVGLSNEISGNFASVSGGAYNTASGDFASVSGGGGVIFVPFLPPTRRVIPFGNIASGEGASVSGGQGNIASGNYASVSGGGGATVTPFLIFKRGNVASGYTASVSGGAANTAADASASVSGGLGITQSTVFGWSAGSEGEAMSGRFSSP